MIDSNNMKKSNCPALSILFLYLVLVQLINFSSGAHIHTKQANSIEICTVESPTEDTICETEVSYYVVIGETATGTIDIRQPFVVRTADPNSKYTVKYGFGTEQIIQNALAILPSGESSGVTQYSLAVQDPAYLDFDGNNGFWVGHRWGDIVSSSKFFNVTVSEIDTNNTATAKITLIVGDRNDEIPTFQGVDPETSEYNFLVCENLEEGTALKLVTIKDPENPICPETTGEIDLQILATDRDIDYPYSRIRYRWASDSKLPPLTIDNATGKMTVNSAVNFDFETSKEEVYIVEAYDNPDDPDNQMVSRIAVRFTILDKNDEPNSIEICTVENPTEDTVCETEVSYYVVIPETVTGTIDIGQPLIGRTANPNSSYSLSYEFGISPIIQNALSILPDGGSSGVTEFSFAVRNSSYLDFDGNNGFWSQIIWGDLVPRPHTFNVIASEKGTDKTATAKITLIVQDREES